MFRTRRTKINKMTDKKEIEELKLEILKEFQRQMIYKGYSILDVYEIGKKIRNKFNIEFDKRTKKQIIEDARKEFCE